MGGVTRAGFEEWRHRVAGPALVCTNAGGMASKQLLIAGDNGAIFADLSADAQLLFASLRGSRMDSGIVLFAPSACPDDCDGAPG
jgi:hypothetical protein